MSYKWTKKGAIDFNGEEIIPAVGSDVTELCSSLDESVIKNLLDDGRIVDDTEEKAAAARLLAKQQRQIDAAIKKANKKSAGGGRSK